MGSRVSCCVRSPDDSPLLETIPRPPRSGARWTRYTPEPDASVEDFLRFSVALRAVSVKMGDDVESMPVFVGQRCSDLSAKFLSVVTPRSREEYLLLRSPAVFLVSPDEDDYAIHVDRLQDRMYRHSLFRGHEDLAASARLFRSLFSKVLCCAPAGISGANSVVCTTFSPDDVEELQSLRELFPDSAIEVKVATGASGVLRYPPDWPRDVFLQGKNVFVQLPGEREKSAQWDPVRLAPGAVVRTAPPRTLCAHLLPPQK